MTHPALPEGLIDAMKAAALEAGQNALRCKAEGIESELKEDQSLVTIADKQGEDIIHQHLDGFEFDFIGEETGETITGSDFAFVVDPIDGTTNYSIGDPDWLVSIGVTYKGTPIAGVCYQPELDKLYVAESGKGATLTQHGETKPLNQRGKEPAAYVYDILSNRPMWQEVASLHHLMREAILDYTNGKQKPRYRSTGCPSVPLCQMAEGARSGIICWPIALHDIAAGMVIAQEAGAKVQLQTNDREKPPYHYEIVASIPQLFDKAKEAFANVTGKLAHFYPGRAEDGVVERMQEDGIRYGVSVGRRQPMHKMHMDCIQEMADAGLKPIIVIGSANNGKNTLFNPLENPLSETQQRAQIMQAMQKAGIEDYEVLALPDMGNMEDWAASVRHLLKANGIDPTKAVCHYRAKEDTAKDAAKLVKPMKASNEALMRYGMSVWESYNAEPEKMDGISATAFRSMDLRAAENQATMHNKLVAPDFIHEQAEDARSLDPDLELLDALPISMLDLTLKRMREERGLSTRDILRGEPAFSLEQLTDAIKNALKTPSPEVEGDLQAISGQQRSRT